MANTTARTGTARAGGGLPGALAAEWTKLWGLRSTWTCLAAALVLAAGTCVMGAESILHSGGATRIDAQALTQMATLLPQFALVALASLVVTGEYAAGAARTTLTAVPRRGVLLAAKAVVTAVVALLAGVLIGLVSLAVTAWYFGDALEVSASGLFHALLGPGLFLAPLALLVLGAGAALRSTAGTVTGAIGLLVGVPLLAQIIGSRRLLGVVDYTPTPLGQVLTSGVDVPHSPALSALFMVCWAAGGLAVGYAALRGRDA